MFDFTLPPPAIIEVQEVKEVRFELSYAPSRTDVDRFIVPRDYREATTEELRAYIPSDLQDMPDWVIQSMFPLFAKKTGSAEEIFVFLTSTSNSAQTWNVPLEWNSGDNKVYTIGGGGSGGGVSGTGTRIAGGGGGGACAWKSNISLTPSSSVNFYIRNRATNGTGNGGTGGDTLFNGTTMGTASVGAKGGSGGVGNLTTGNPTNSAGGQAANSVGDVRFSGSNGGSTDSGSVSGGGGGAAGPESDGGSASQIYYGKAAGSPNGGGQRSSNSGSTGNPGTTWGPNHGSGGGGSSRSSANGSGGDGGNYGGGGGGAWKNSGGSAASGGQGAQGLIVITYFV